MIKNGTNILVVTSEFPPQPGGIGNHAFHLAAHLQHCGMEVQVLSDNRSLDGDVEKAFDQSFKVKVHRISVRRFRFLMYLKRIRVLFRVIKSVDVVLASGKFSLWAVAFASWFYHKTFVAVVHGTEVNFKSFVLKRSIEVALKRFTKVICVSNYTKSLIAHLKLKQVAVIPNGIDTSKWQASAVKHVALEGHPKLVTVGNVTERKGQLQVIRQLPELLKTFPELQYHCIGIPTERERFLEVAKQLHVDAHITFHGAVDDVRLKQLVASCDIFVMLSSATATGDVEGFGIAILDANALGLPAIGSLGCGIEDAIQPNQSGVLIPVDDGTAFVKAISTINENKEVFAENANKWASEHDWKIIVERYLELLTQSL
ncbi:MAG TPA: glycosyltransferase family 4 protein [Flavobacteriaceae bacterium]|nr:glycosyltransferase family 4 protein [Flavobacteriaceae bacterium]